MTKINDIHGNVLFECDSDNIKDCLLKALERGADLCGANIRGADLYGANLYGADLRGADLRGANIRGADIRCADLGGANLRGADLYGADLYGANLYSANLYGANLRGANLYGANIRGADLGGANLRGANLYGADLCGANIRGADLYGADLYGANLYGAKNIPYIPMFCPSDGEFTAWKKADGKLVKLLIPADARRSSATTNKCRCDKAMVVAITSLDGKEEYSETTSYTCTPLTYRVGETVCPDSFDENRWEECSNGIHFFINKQDAINY